MRLIRWGTVVALVALNLVMKAPVWFLIAHVRVFGGSSSYHRADLVDTFIKHFSDWWLLGTNSNNSWGYFMFDTSNQYVQMGVTGGLFALVFFVLTISRAFWLVGRARKVAEGDDHKTEWFLWLLGSAVFANAVAFFGISYFDQTKVSWFALLAMVSAVTAPLLNAKAVAEERHLVGTPLESSMNYGWPSPAGSNANRARVPEGRRVDSGRVTVQRK